MNLKQNCKIICSAVSKNRTEFLVPAFFIFFGKCVTYPCIPTSEADNLFIFSFLLKRIYSYFSFLSLLPVMYMAVMIVQRNLFYESSKDSSTCVI
jgi:hypothetical protein